MSIEIDWDTLTGGPDGEVLAENIRAFVHDRFQKVALPRMIRSVQVHAFSFGSAKPDIELKDVCDPLPDFYEDDEDGTDEQSAAATPKSTPESATPSRAEDHLETRRDLSQSSRLLNEGRSNRLSALMSEGLSMSPTRSATPRLPGGMSNLGYFHLPLSAGLSGASTPLAAVAGARFPAPWIEQQAHSSSTDSEQHSRGRSHSSITPPGGQSSRPNSTHDAVPPSIERLHSDATAAPRPDRAQEDLQVMARISYDGDVRLSLTAEILLDYPTPSFVGIPLQLHITGLKFDGIAILAHIKKKAHFCFLSPEDAETLVDAPADVTQKAGGLIEEIRVESEIGQKDGGKQVLKNVGKIEKFILEQVRKIFEDEFVYPSFWTFLV